MKYITLKIKLIFIGLLISYMPCTSQITYNQPIKQNNIHDSIINENNNYSDEIEKTKITVVTEEIEIYNVKDWENNLFEKFNNAEFINQIWNEGYEKHLKKAEVFIFQTQDRIENFNEIILFAKLNQGLETGLWYCIYDDENKVIDYLTLSHKIIGAGDFKGGICTGKFQSKTTYRRNYKTFAFGKEMTETALCIIHPNGHINEIIDTKY